MNPRSHAWISKNWDELQLFHIQYGGNLFGIKFEPVTVKEYRELLKKVKEKKELEK